MKKCFGIDRQENFSMENFKNFLLLVAKQPLWEGLDWLVSVCTHMIKNICFTRKSCSLTFCLSYLSVAYLFLKPRL